MNNKQAYFDKYKNQQLQEQELQRKYNLYLYEQQLLEMMELAAKSGQSPAVGGGKDSDSQSASNSLPSSFPFSL